MVFNRANSKSLNFALVFVALKPSQSKLKAKEMHTKRTTFPIKVNTAQRVIHFLFFTVSLSSSKMSCLRFLD